MLLAVLAVLAALVFAACGSDDDEQDTASQGSSQSTSAEGSATDDSLVEGANEVVEIAKTDQVYSSNFAPTQVDEIEPYGEWRGPDSAPAHESGKNLQVILCTKQAEACVEVGNQIAKAGEVLGWKVEILDGAGTPEGYARAMNTALGRNADAIIGVAVPGATVGDQLAKAKEAGVVTVAMADEPGSGFDAYVQVGQPLMHAVLAYQDIARTNGESRTIIVNDSGIKDIGTSSETYAKVMESCSKCETTTVEWTIADASDPTKVAPVVRGGLAEMPDATTLLIPYGIPIAAVADTLRQAGKQDQVQVLAKDADAQELQGIRDGDVFATAGTSLGWQGWAAVDQVVRGMADAPYLEPAATGLSVGLYAEDNLPPDNDLDKAANAIDYQAEYKRIWGGN